MKRKPSRSTEDNAAKRQRGDELNSDIEALKALGREDIAVYARFLSDRSRREIIDALTHCPTDKLADYVGLLNQAQRQLREEEFLKKQSAEAAAARTYEVTENKEGRLVVMFMAVGSGDCIFVKTPGGNVIVVDCGTRGRPTDRPNYVTDLSNMLNSALFLGGKKGLYALILTHPDQDHYNDLASVLNGLHIEHVFSSAPLGDFGWTRKNTDIPAGKFVLGSSTNRNLVNIRDNVTTIVTDPPNPHAPYVVNNTEQWIEILTEPSCTIKFLAAAVPNIADKSAVRARYQHGVKLKDGKVKDTKLKRRGVGDAEGTNSASIITLIEAHGRKVLLCGDATYSTEVFLLDKHRNRINNVDLGQVEHHGAGTPHGGSEYVECIDPILAAISTGSHGNDNNPRWRILKKYLGLRGSGKTAKARRLATAMDEHYVQHADETGWITGEKDEWAKNYKTRGLYSTHSSGDLCFLVNTNGDLVREFSAKKRDSEETEKRSYTIRPDNTIVVS